MCLVLTLACAFGVCVPCTYFRKYTWSLCALYLFEEVHLEFVCLVLT